MMDVRGTEPFLGFELDFDKWVGGNVMRTQDEGTQRPSEQFF